MMERYEKCRRPLTLAVCVLFVAGLLMSVFGGAGALGVIGNVVLVLALIPAGVIWLLERKREEGRKEQTGSPGKVPAEPDEKPEEGSAET